MSTAKAIIEESTTTRHLRGLPSRTRGKQPSQRLRKIRDITSRLVEEISALEHESNLAEASDTLATLGLNGRIDLADEVRRFEIKLIRRALELTGGNQARAAEMLGLGTTTLNYKVKTYELL
jgi:DNA-binding NtrC family response regulator